jgi:hypothetical protein
MHSIVTQVAFRVFREAKRRRLLRALKMKREAERAVVEFAPVKPTLFEFGQDDPLMGGRSTMASNSPGAAPSPRLRHTPVLLDWRCAILKSDVKVANRNVNDISGGRSLTRPFSRRPPISLDTVVARTPIYTYAANVWDPSLVQGPFSVARASFLRATSRNFIHQRTSCSRLR